MGGAAGRVAGQVGPMSAPFPLTHVGLYAALDALGATGDEVVRTLEAGGHLPAAKGDHPVERYLLAVIPGVERVYLDRCDAAIWPAGAGEEVEMCLTAAVKSFIIRFDAGMRGAPYAPTHAGLRAALAALGDTPRAVEATLTAGGHRGVPGDCENCPIARYLHAVIPAAYDLHLDEAEVVVWPAEPGDGRDVVPVIEPLPLSVRIFVAGFDHGGYAHLAVDG